MLYRVQLVKGLLQPSRSRYQLTHGEAILSIRLKLIVLYIASVLLFVIGAYNGIGSESISKMISAIGPSEYEARKILFVIGKAITGLLYPTIFIFFTSLLFWIITEVEYKKILVVQMIVFVLNLLEKAISIPVFLLLDIGKESDPFSFGIIGQYITDNGFLIAFLGHITIFQILIIAVQYFYLKALSEQKNNLLLIVISIIYIGFWLFQALFSYIKIEAFF